MSTAVLLLELATGEVQGAAGQRLVEVEDEDGELMGDSGSWLHLPERPVSDISSLTIDGGDELIAGTDYIRTAGSAQLWRACGWSDYIYQPSIVAFTYSHGRPVGDQKLQPARSATLALAQAVTSNPSGVLAESIDDYRVQFAAQLAALMEASPALQKSLRRTYGRRGGPVRVG
jgi:hypothetical protein